MASKKTYSEETMEKAIEMLKSGISISKAAKNCSVPKPTLTYRIVHPSVGSHGQAPGLSKDDEMQIVNYAKFMANAGAPVTSKWLCETAGQIAKQR